MPSSIEKEIEEAICERALDGLLITEADVRPPSGGSFKCPVIQHKKKVALVPLLAVPCYWITYS